MGFHHTVGVLFACTRSDSEENAACSGCRTTLQRTSSNHRKTQRRLQRNALRDNWSEWKNRYEPYRGQQKPKRWHVPLRTHHPIVRRQDREPVPEGMPVNAFYKGTKDRSRMRN